MTRREDDRSAEHLAWLVRNRSANQQVTLRLYTLMKREPKAFAVKVGYAEAAELLAGAAFSLWRAVFLSDLAETPEEQMADVTAFLGVLIASNAIGYPQDRNARGWTFPYYVEDARFRLEKLANEHPRILAPGELASGVLSAKEQWEQEQEALETAVSRLEALFP